MQTGTIIRAACAAAGRAIISRIACPMTASIAMVILFASSSLAQDPQHGKEVQPETSAEAIVTRYLDVIGGTDAIKAVKSKQITYQVHMFGRDTYVMESLWTRPDSKRTGSPGAATYTLTEGARSWRVSPDGRRELPEVVARSLAKQADIDGPLVDPSQKGVTLSYAGLVNYDMSELHQVTVTFADSVRWEFFFDARTGLLRKLIQPSFFMLNDQISRGPDVHVYYYDYRAVGSILYPHYLIQISDDHTHLFVVEDIRVNEQ